MIIQYLPGFYRQNRNVLLASEEGLNCAGIITSSTSSAGWDVSVQFELVGLSLKCNICTGLRWDDILLRPWLCQMGSKFLGYLVPFEPYRPLSVPYALGRVQASPPPLPASPLQLQLSYKIKF